MSDSLTYNYQGVFIAIDGPNGVGKSTVITELFKQLKEKYSGYQIIVITEPSKTIIGDSIRQFSENKIHNTTLLSLVAADREYNHVEYIRPLLEDKKVILISDRYFSSSLVYQKMHGLNTNTILSIHRNIYIPDALFILQSDPDSIRHHLLSRNLPSQLFENPNNVEREILLFDDCIPTLKEYDYTVSRIIHTELNKTVDLIRDDIEKIISFKSN